MGITNRQCENRSDSPAQNHKCTFYSALQIFIGVMTSWCLSTGTTTRWKGNLPCSGPECPPKWRRTGTRNSPGTRTRCRYADTLRPSSPGPPVKTAVFDTAPTIRTADTEFQVSTGFCRRKNTSDGQPFNGRSCRRSRWIRFERFSRTRSLL